MNTYRCNDMAEAQRFVAEAANKPGIGIPAIIDCGYAVFVQIWDRAA